MLLICIKVSSLKWSKSVVYILGLSLLFITINLIMLNLFNNTVYTIAGLISSIICTVVYFKILQNLLGISILTKMKLLIANKKTS